MVRFLSAHRGFTPKEQQFVKLLHDCNLQPGRMVHILSMIHNKTGKLSSMPYLPSDVVNLVAKYHRESQLTDMEDTIAYFMAKREG